jgi:putative Ca2+/H+ antiporter (TMEM165/GDT1 family)
VLLFISAVALAFGAVFVAEFGDKSQLLILAFATRYPARPVVVGLVLAAALIQGISVVIGAAVGAVLPEVLVSAIAGLAFLAVAGWTAVGREDDDAHAPKRAGGRRTTVEVAIAVAAAFVVAELGDKTMLATFALAASQGPLSTWLGSTLGEVAANLVAVVVGRQVGSRFSPRLVRFGSVALFALGGLIILAGVAATLLAPR